MEYLKTNCMQDINYSSIIFILSILTLPHKDKLKVVHLSKVKDISAIRLLIISIIICVIFLGIDMSRIEYS